MSTPTVYIFHGKDTSCKVVVCAMSEESAKEIAEDILGVDCFIASEINPMQLGYKVYK